MARRGAMGVEPRDAPAGYVCARRGDVAEHTATLLEPRIIESTENAGPAVWAVPKDNNNPLFEQDKPCKPRFDNPYCSLIYDRAETLYKCRHSSQPEARWFGSCHTVTLSSPPAPLTLD